MSTSAAPTGTRDNPATPSPAQRSDYAELSRIIRDAGLLKRRHGRYAVKFVLTALAFAGGCVAFALLGDS